MAKNKEEKDFYYKFLKNNRRYYGDYSPQIKILLLDKDKNTITEYIDRGLNHSKKNYRDIFCGVSGGGYNITDYSYNTTPSLGFNCATYNSGNEYFYKTVKYDLPIKYIKDLKQIKVERIWEK